MIPLQITIGDKYGAAMEMTDPAIAESYFEELIDHHMRSQQGRMPSRAEAVRVEKANLGYYAGYYSSETRERVERLFGCAHPIFGPVATNGSPPKPLAGAPQ